MLTIFSPTMGSQLTLKTYATAFFSFADSFDPSIIRIIRPGVEVTEEFGFPDSLESDPRLKQLPGNELDSSLIKTASDAIFAVNAHFDDTALIAFCSKETRATVLKAKDSRINALKIEQTPTE